jgi:hypothetical protein
VPLGEPFRRSTSCGVSLSGRFQPESRWSNGYF